jgi:hypothetical protein
VHEVTFVIGNLIVIDKSDQEVLRTEAFRDRPNEWAYAQHLGKLQWVSLSSTRNYGSRFSQSAAAFC